MVVRHRKGAGMGEENSRRGMEKRESTFFILVKSAPENIYLSLPQNNRGFTSSVNWAFASDWDFPSWVRLSLRVLGWKDVKGPRGQGSIRAWQGWGAHFHQCLSLGVCPPFSALERGMKTIVPKLTRALEILCSICKTLSFSLVPQWCVHVPKWW